MIYRFDLPASLTHRVRRYTLVPVRSELADGFLTVQQGEVGPRGGTSGLDVSSYFVQEVGHDRPTAWREFLLVRDVPGNEVTPFTFDRDDESAEPYCVWVATDRGCGSCTCRAYRNGRMCKHLDALAHLVRVAGWEGGRGRPTAEVAVA